MISAGAIVLPVLLPVLVPVFASPGTPDMTAAFPMELIDPGIAVGDDFGSLAGPVATLEVQRTSSNVAAVSRVLASTWSILLLFVVSKCDYGCLVVLIAVSQKISVGC